MTTTVYFRISLVFDDKYNDCTLRQHKHRTKDFNIETVTSGYLGHWVFRKGRTTARGLSSVGTLPGSRVDYNRQMPMCKAKELYSQRCGVGRLGDTTRETLGPGPCIVCWVILWVRFLKLSSLIALGFAVIRG